MNAPELKLIPYICPDCDKTYYTLKSSHVWCPKCHQWVNQDTGKLAGSAQKPTRAKPYYSCQRCGNVFRANSNREKYCKSCKPFMVRERTRNRVQKFRSKMIPCNVLDTI